MKQTRTRIGRTVPSGPRPAARGPRRRVAVWLLVPALAWGAGASWLAWRGGVETVQALADGAAQKAAYDEKVRALTRRLVGVASHQMLEQDGLADRMADIVTRQVELETRAATLAGYAERIADPSRAAEAPPARARTDEETTREAARAAAPDPRGRAPDARTPDGNVLRIGGPPPASGTGPRSALDAPARPDRVRELLALPTRAQFDALEASQARVEAVQAGALGTLAQAARTGFARIRTLLADLGITPALPPLPATPRVAGPRDAFTEGTRLVDAALAEMLRWRAAADAAPLRRPIEAAERNLTSNFGTRKDPFTGAATMHAGMDFRAPVGTGVTATAAGRVVTASVSGGYGNLVEIDHGNGVVTRYGHLSAYQVAVGQGVQADAVIGFVGSTGRSTGPHLHYETRLNGVAVDPMRFLKAGAELRERGQPAEARLSQAAADETSED